MIMIKGYFLLFHHTNFVKFFDSFYFQINYSIQRIPTPQMNQIIKTVQLNSIAYNNQMYTRGDSSFEGIMYKPHFSDNITLDKRSMKGRKEILQSLNMRKPLKTKPNEQSQFILTNSPSSLKKSKDNLHLPDIYLYSKPKHQEIISIEDNEKLVKEIAKNLNFINKKIPVLNLDFYSIFDENTKSIPYESELYKKEINLMNIIFKDVGINLKPRDVMILEGQKSKSQYTIFTSYPKHPQSLCCESEIIIKHFEFLSPKKLYFAKEKSFDVPLKSFISLSCLGCKREIMKIRPSENQKTKIDHNMSDFEEQKKLLKYSKLISSGRFKKALINDESVQIMQGRKIPLARSKMRMAKLHELSHTEHLKPPRYTQYDRESRIKSYQDTLQLTESQRKLKLKSKYEELQELITKRQNHNISEVLIRKSEEN